MQNRSLTFILLLSCCSLFCQAQKADQNEIDLLIERHNFWRNAVGVSDINYSQELAEVANKWAIELKRQKCAFKHSKNDYGENLFKGTTGYYTVGDAVDSWGEEKSDYNYSKNKCKNGAVCGHYTQIVWENTTSVGCAKSTCGGYVTWVCNYDPPGNWVGQKPY